MANTAVFGGTGGNVIYSASYDYTADGKWLDALKYGGAEFRFEMINSPGVDGCGTKDHGFRSQDIELMVVYVAADTDACITAFDDDLDIICGRVNTLAVNGRSLGAVIVSGKQSFMEQPKKTALPSAKVTARARIVCQAVR